MSLGPDGAGNATVERTQPTHDLSMTVVEYTDKPDHCTVSPRGLSDVTKLPTRITVDRTVVVDPKTMQ